MDVRTSRLDCNAAVIAALGCDEPPSAAAGVPRGHRLPMPGSAAVGDSARLLLVRPGSKASRAAGFTARRRAGC